MLLRNLLTISLAVLASNLLPAKVLAGQPLLTSVETKQFQNRKPTSSQLNQKQFNPDNFLLAQVSIPKFSAVTTTFCSNVLFNHEQASVFSITLSLARPIMDSNGNVIAPVNSLVRAKIDTTDEEKITIQPEAISVGGRYIPIQTSSVKVPVINDTRRSSRTFFSGGFNRGQRGVAFRVSENLSDWIVSRPNALDEDSNDLLSFGLSVVMGVAQGLNEPKPPDPEETKVMEIREGMQLIFPLESSVELPQMPNYRSPYFANREPATVCQSGEIAQTQNSTQYDDSNEID